MQYYLLFHGNNCYVNALQYYVVSTWSALLLIEAANVLAYAFRDYVRVCVCVIYCVTKTVLSIRQRFKLVDRSKFSLNHPYTFLTPSL